jgi:hypothetical protein
MSKRHQRSKIRRWLSTPNLLIAGTVLGLIAFGIWVVFKQDDDAGDTSRQAAIQMPHIHGLSFSSDGKQLIVPAHSGLLVFENDRWVIPDLPPHDYMGYAGVDNGFFSSGHPNLGTDLVNPLGLVKSTDGGKTITTLAFEGESDFHVMAVGYESHAVYVLNTSPNSQLGIGLYHSQDEGESWQQSRAGGLGSGIIQLGVHPTETGIVAAATEQGVFLSTDHGDSFAQVGDAAPVTAVTFHPNGETLYFGYKVLYQYELSDGTIDTLSIPPLIGDDGITYIALNPVSNEIALATFSKNLYRSKDGGQSWQQIARQGEGLDL